MFQANSISVARGMKRALALVSILSALAISAVIWRSSYLESTDLLSRGSPPVQQWFQNFDRMLNHPPKVSRVFDFIPVWSHVFDC